MGFDYLLCGLVDTVELRKQSSCSMQLTNKTDQYVAFKVNIFSLNHNFSLSILMLL